MSSGLSVSVTRWESTFFSVYIKIQVGTWETSEVEGLDIIKINGVGK